MDGVNVPAAARHHAAVFVLGPGAVPAPPAAKLERIFCANPLGQSFGPSLGFSVAAFCSDWASPPSTRQVSPPSPFSETYVKRTPFPARFIVSSCFGGIPAAVRPSTCSRAGTLAGPADAGSPGT